MIYILEENKVIANILLEKKDSNIPVRISGPLSKLDIDKMTEMLNDNKKDNTIKEYYKNEAQRASATIKILDKKISKNLTMSSKKIEIITQLKKLHNLRGEYFVNKFNNDPEKNEFMDLTSIDHNINKLQDEFRNQEGSGVFTYQNEFVKLLNLLAQLFTKKNSKKRKDDMNQLLKKLYNSKQINKQVYNILIKAITYKNDS